MITDMKHLISLFVLSGVLFVSGCRETDVRTMTVKIPAMTSEEDVQRVRKALAPLNGVNKALVVFDEKEHKITLTYDSMVVAEKNIEIAIAEAGYDANGILAIRAAAK
jgi:copper chaperone CopZ